MLAKVSAYVEGEAEISIEDYRLLKAMNLAAAERYSNMADYSSGLVALAERLQTKCEAMLPQLAQVRVLQPKSDVTPFPLTDLTQPCAHPARRSMCWRLKLLNSRARWSN